MTRWQDQANQPIVGVLPKIRRKPRGILGVSSTDGTLARPPAWTIANVGSACICVIPSYPRESAFPLSCPRVAHKHQVGEGTPGRETAAPSSSGARQIAVLARVLVRTTPCVAGSSARHW